jgi:hypothetical protein
MHANAMVDKLWLHTRIFSPPSLILTNSVKNHARSMPSTLSDADQTQRSRFSVPAIDPAIDRTIECTPANDRTKPAIDRRTSAQMPEATEEVTDGRSSIA